ncbi:endolytic transglycosylase MltG [Rikenellaceae bacterium DSM 108975]|nr:endolytic transglycosylase MltG [Gallalistipes aquisgranensis]
MKLATRIFRISVAVCLAAVAASTAAFYLSQRGSAVVHDTDLYLPTGADYATLLDSLGRSGEKIRQMPKFRNHALLAGLHKGVHPGRYRLKEGMSYGEVIAMLRQGHQTPVRVTFNNIRTLPQLAGAVARQLEPDSASLAALFTSDSAAAAYGFAPAEFLGMFVPNTYEFYWNTSPAGFLARMKKEYDRFWDRERRALLDSVGLSRTEAVTLASIVYEETKMSDEMPTVAGVYMNRLRIGMPLQADPTVKFAVGDFTLRRILNRHLTVDSPYNTYKHTGLPPGPICMPSIRAVDAVLNYRHHKYLYFCAKPDFSGYHVFSATLAGHNRNAQAYARALNEAKIYR